MTSRETKLCRNFEGNITQILSGRPLQLETIGMSRFAFSNDEICDPVTLRTVSGGTHERGSLTHDIIDIEIDWTPRWHWKTRLCRR